jgi:hypothetical protein
MNDLILQRIGNNQIIICKVINGNIEIIGKYEGNGTNKDITEWIQVAYREWKINQILEKKDF